MIKQLKEVNREHIWWELVVHMTKIVKEGGKCPPRTERIAWAVKTYKEKGEPYDFVEKFGKDLKCSRTVQRYHKVLN